MKVQPFSTVTRNVSEQREQPDLRVTDSNTVAAVRLYDLFITSEYAF
jgi:hypothetical protein